jgi:hypothetical protein
MMHARTFNSGATIEIIMKDVDLAIAQGEERGFARRCGSP